LTVKNQQIYKQIEDVFHIYLQNQTFLLVTIAFIIIPSFFSSSMSKHSIKSNKPITLCYIYITYFIFTHFSESFQSAIERGWKKNKRRKSNLCNISFSLGRTIPENSSWLEGA